MTTMAEPRRGPTSLTYFAAVLAMFVALGAVLAAQPFDAWTPVYVGGDTDAPPIGDHALPLSENRNDRVARARRCVRRPQARLRSLRVRWDAAVRARRHPVLVGFLFPCDGWGRWRSAPAPDRAPPRLIAA
jgi:hypothetical protein